MSPIFEIQSPSNVRCVQELPVENTFNRAFGYLRADVTAMRSQCMQGAYCHDHKVWHDLHDLERALVYAEEKMKDLSCRIVPTKSK